MSVGDRLGDGHWGRVSSREEGAPRLRTLILGGGLQLDRGLQAGRATTPIFNMERIQEETDQLRVGCTYVPSCLFDAALRVLTSMATALYLFLLLLLPCGHCIRKL